MQEIKHFRFWCQKVLPLVYDDSLSYYEVLCKVVEYLNNVISDANGFTGQIDRLDGEIAELEKELKVVQTWIDNFDTSYAEEIISKSIATMVFFGINDNGYFVVNIPKSWRSIRFATTGYDINVPVQPEYGHLCLLY